MSYASEVLADTPEGFWRFHESSGNPQDSSGNGHHVTSVIGTPTYGQTSPITSDAAAKAIKLAGTAGFVVPGSGEFYTGDTYSLEAWIKLAGNGTVRWIFNKQSGSFGMWVWSDNYLAMGKVDTGNVIRNPNTMTDTSWHHVVATKNGSTDAKLYIDANDVSGVWTDQDIVDNDENLRLGIAYNETSGYFNDILCELAIYPSVLSLSRVQAHYAAATASAPASPVNRMLLLGAG